MNDKYNEQIGGDNSSNYQAGNNLTINQNGLSVADIKEIILLVIQENLIKFSEQARATARMRAEEMTTDYLNQLIEKNPNLIEKIQEPGVEMALVSAQREYVKTGDKELADLLVKMLVERTSLPQRTLLQISLDEAIVSLGKLTNNQIGLILMNFVISSTTREGVNSLDSLKQVFDSYIKPIVEAVKEGNNDIPHIVSCNCAVILPRRQYFVEEWISRCSGLFNRGFTEDDAKAKLGNAFWNLKLINPLFFITCLHDAKKIQINAINSDNLDKILTTVSIEPEAKEIARMLFINNIMSLNEAANYLKSFGEYMEKALSLWYKESVSKLALSNIGRAIAITAYNKQFGTLLKYKDWIVD